MKTKRVCGTPLIAAIAAALVVLTLPMWSAARPLEVGDELPQAVLNQIPEQWQKSGFLLLVYGHFWQTSWHKETQDFFVKYYPVVVLYTYKSQKEYDNLKAKTEELAKSDPDHLRVVYAGRNDAGENVVIRRSPNIFQQVRYGDDIFTFYEVPTRVFVRGGCVQLVGLAETPEAPIGDNPSAQLVMSVEDPKDVPFVMLPYTSDFDGKPGEVKCTAEPVRVSVTVRRTFLSEEPPFPIDVKMTLFATPYDPVTGPARETYGTPIGARDTLSGGRRETSVLIPEHTVRATIVLEYRVGDVVMRINREVYLWPEDKGKPRYIGDPDDRPSKNEPK